MLASDVNNADFVGAKDPDSGLYVEFFWHEPVDAWASREASIAAQRKVVVKLAKTAFIRIMVPGDKTSEFTAEVSEAHKQRFPRQWLAWQISEGLIGGEGDIPGWKLSEWDEINADQVRELLYMRFQTVEQLAGANDRQIQGIGMGGLALREKARVALRNKMGSETREAMEARDSENAQLKERLARMEEAMAKLLGGAALPGAPALDPLPEAPAPVVAEAGKRGPGRPPREAAPI